MIREHKVIERRDFLYAKKDEDLIRFYREILNILANEFNFDKVREKPHTEYEPAKPKLSSDILAIKEKDPRTRIEIIIKYRYKVPPEKHKTSKDILNVTLTYVGNVITEYKKETTWEKTIFYQALIRIIEYLFYKKEWEKYKEECEELVISLTNRIRELYNQIPSIGRSTREYYTPSG